MSRRSSDPTAEGGLLATLRARSASDGPLTIADYMAEALTHPARGYYTTGDPFGADGDFVTAPEISQMFGELLGLWAAEAWQRLGRPPRLRLVELGPGRGTLLTDLLRAAGWMPGFRDTLHLDLVELSPALRAVQARTLAAAGAAPHWHDSLATVPEDAPILCLANEFFDALPVRQFVRGPAGWCERLVTADPDGPGLAFALGPPSPKAAAYVPRSLRDAPPGSVVEVAPAALSLATEMGRRVAEQGGGALILDYGRATPAAEATLQALRRHARADPLAAPGSADLTAHVDFPMLAQALAEGGAEVHGPVAQGDFLHGLGIAERAEVLRRHATASQAEALDAAVARLCESAQMGTLFKALAALPPGVGVPAGFPETPRGLV